MKTVGNILWLVLTGFVNCIMWFFLGAIWCITVVGLPFGKQCFKLGILAIWPMGKNIETGFFKHPILNLVWIGFGGFGLTISYLVSALAWSVTVIGLPFGIQCLKLAVLSVAPFGAEIK